MWAISPGMRLPRGIPLAPPSIKIAGNTPVVSCAKSAVRQWDAGQFANAERTVPAISMHLMDDIPNTVQAVANDQHNRQPEAENTEHGEHNHSFGFESPRSVIFEIGGERQVKRGDGDEKQGKKDLLCFRRS